MEYLRKRYLGVFSGLAGGFVFLLLSGKFAAADTMPVLQAVLDTNFWLSTHVTVITTGYMACCVAGLIGHVYMVQAILQGRPGGRDRVTDRRLAHTYRTMFGTLALGLTFSFIGTMLGGIWADQSWGRFWGWDPKENGALLIVLWCAILFHARMGKMIGPFGMAAGSGAAHRGGHDGVVRHQSAGGWGCTRTASSTACCSVCWRTARHRWA